MTAPVAGTDARLQGARIVSSYRADIPRSCDECGTGIQNVAIVRTADGRTMAIGTTCAERVGISPAELSRHRAEERQARYVERQASRPQVEARPEPFRGVDRPETLRRAIALFDLDGGWVPSRLVDSRYGLKFVTDDDTWVSYSRAKNPERRRAADAARGYYVGWALFGWRDDSPDVPVAILDNGLVPELAAELAHRI